ncbi:hypothetical protein PR202_ga06438 [Eleusine coracana subsp. coracana]|uniref:Uncharacterized protein n=1 Tax=Eleusine coracana subsp. coracana TaxID=191504 RepID=A0AAV5BUT9_ELECO|nr:hypothetical protein PR202_ga06438 [Eleusine coracana subsp. coracana]
MGGSLSIPVAVFIAYTVVVSSVSCFCGWRARAAVVKLDMDRAINKSQRRVARRAAGDETGSLRRHTGDGDRDPSS